MAETGGRRRVGGEGLDLHLGVDRAAGFVGRALETALREAIRSGRLHPGSRLPGSRSLAADLRVSRGTVVQAYAQLIAEGWLTGAAGSGTRVAELPVGGTRPVLGSGLAAVGFTDPAPEAAAGRTAQSARLMIDLRPGRPDLSSFPRTEWASSVRRALAAVPYESLDYTEPAGLPVLRVAVADYVTRARGVRADASAVVITAGFTPGLALLARTLHGLGMRTVATEDPGLAKHRGVLNAAGLVTVPLEVGADGASPEGLAGQAAVLTPAHQYPRGVVLAARHRSAFVDWARREDGFIVEDDYDGEFRYDQQPVGAMQALAPDRVVFAGSTSKTLAPGMRLGWLVVPAALRGPLLEVMANAGAAVPVVEQLAMADLIGRGGYDRHIRRMRLVYRRRRADLAEVAARSLEGVAAGLHALLPLESAEQERVLIGRARQTGLALHGLHAHGYWREPGSDRPAALILGYATPPPHAWSRALGMLAEVVQEIGG
jgi:GntR family transcriptional regulator/MocR family aminotransferase